MTSPPSIPNDDYDAIEAAVMDTARGRWFLAEFARRNRTADTTLLLTAIERLESMLDRDDDAPPAPHEPVTTRAITSSAASELFAVDAQVEPAALPAPGIPAAGLPDDGHATWVIDEPPSTEALRAKPEDEDEDILLPADGFAHLPPLLSASSSGPRIERSAAPLQSAMLAAALAQAEETMARAAEPEPPAAPSGYSPGMVDPSELDALSFEEKSVYFA
jgi:hypothetical protein